MRDEAGSSATRRFGEGTLGLVTAGLMIVAVLCLLFALCMAVAACLLEGISYAIGRRWRRWRARRHQWLKPGALPPPQDSVLRTRRPIEADGHNVIQFKRRA